MNDRTVRILDILASNSKVKITMLADLLCVSQVTLRKDLDYLEKQDIVCRSHGYASLDGADDTGKRMAVNYPVKLKIARAAAQLIEENETVMIESGSCCALFAEELAMQNKNVTIITNSTYIANYIKHFAKIKIILLGGYFQPDSCVLVGSITRNCAENFFIDKFFMGADGFISGQGFTGRDYLRVETAIELAKCVKKVFVLTEAAKFLRRGAFNLIKLEKITGVFTDDNIPKDIEASFLKHTIHLTKVSSSDEKINWQKFKNLPPVMYKKKG